MIHDERVSECEAICGNWGGGALVTVIGAYIGKPVVAVLHCDQQPASIVC